MVSWQMGARLRAAGLPTVLLASVCVHQVVSSLPGGDQEGSPDSCQSDSHDFAAHCFENALWAGLCSWLDLYIFMLCRLHNQRCEERWDKGLGFHSLTAPCKVERNALPSNWKTEARAWTGDAGSPGHVLCRDSAIPLKVQELPRVW